MNATGFSIIIPAYNESKIIGEVLDKLIQLKGDYEIIVVNDGSADNTSQIVKDKKIKLIEHSHNKGYGAALKTGIRAADNEIIVALDADGQHNPAEIVSLLSKINDHDMVVGERSKTSKTVFFRRPGKAALSIVANYLAGRKIPDLNSGFRVFKKSMVEKYMHILPNTFSFTTTITLIYFKEGLDVAYVPINTAYRIGKSSVNPIKDGANTLLLILRMIVLFDPLKVFLPISLFCFIFGAGLASYFMVEQMVISKSSILFLLAGLLIFSFGLLADQLSSIRRELRN